MTANSSTSAMILFSVVILIVSFSNLAVKTAPVDAFSVQPWAINSRSIPSSFDRLHVPVLAAVSATNGSDTECVEVDDSGTITVVADSNDVEVIVSDAVDTKSLNRDILQRQSFVRDATDLLESMKDGLEKGSHTDEIVEMKALQEAIDDPSSSSSLLSQRIYELLIEKGMRFDFDTDTGALTETQFTDLTQLLDNRAVKNEFFRLYSFGMQAAMTGVLDSETVKGIVEERLVSRTGLTPVEFDAWLGF